MARESDVETNVVTHQPGPGDQLTQRPGHGPEGGRFGNILVVDTVNPARFERYRLIRIDKLGGLARSFAWCAGHQADFDDPVAHGRGQARRLDIDEDQFGVLHLHGSSPLA
jgi:hypothetical protein